MSILNILEFPDPRLRTVAKPVESVDASLQKLIDDMLETMYAAPGIGLAATQVDCHKQLVVIDVSEGKDQPIVLINPKITHREGEQVYQEGCLSVPGIYADVTRANAVRVDALDRHGERCVIESDGLLAVCIQHELDHLAGKVFVDYLSPLKRDMVRKKLAKQARDKRAAGDREHSL
ncbi:MAG: peptide deformylase [Xanthomonadales bacterium]|nr:peptide deformylase [Xanthomonadales bacterium]